VNITAGTCLGSYEFLALIGVGGEVYEAHDTKLGRDVVIRYVPSGPFPGRSCCKQDHTK